MSRTHHPRTKPRPSIVQVFEGADGFRWRILAPNGRQIAASGEAFASERNAWRAVRGLVGALRHGPSPRAVDGQWRDVARL